MQIDILPSIDLTRSYPRGTYARHDGGIIRSFRDTIPADTFLAAGWEVVIAGVADFRVIQEEDSRSFIVRQRLTGKEQIETRFSLPVMIYRGIWKAENNYAEGDVVTYGGSTWYCLTNGRHGCPSENGTGDSKSWRLIVKEGRRGKDGPEGKQGPPGRDGKDGRDLTQLSFNGTKY